MPRSARVSPDSSSSTGARAAALAVLCDFVSTSTPIDLTIRSTTTPSAAAASAAEPPEAGSEISSTTPSSIHLEHAARTSAGPSGVAESGQWGWSTTASREAVESNRKDWGRKATIGKKTRQKIVGNFEKREKSGLAPNDWGTTLLISKNFWATRGSGDLSLCVGAAAAGACQSLGENLPGLVPLQRMLVQRLS